MNRLIVGQKITRRSSAPLGCFLSTVEPVEQNAWSFHQRVEWVSPAGRDAHLGAETSQNPSPTAGFAHPCLQRTSDQFRLDPTYSLDERFSQSQREIARLPIGRGTAVCGNSAPVEHQGGGSFLCSFRRETADRLRGSTSLYQPLRGSEIFRPELEYENVPHGGLRAFGLPARDAMAKGRPLLFLSFPFFLFGCDRTEGKDRSSSFRPRFAATSLLHFHCAVPVFVF